MATDDSAKPEQPQQPQPRIVTRPTTSVRGKFGSAGEGGITTNRELQEQIDEARRQAEALKERIRREQ